MSGTFGVGIKSLQRGVVTPDANPKTVTITAVDVTKSTLYVSQTAGEAGINYMARGTLTNTTTITFDMVVAGFAYPPKIAWQVRERY